MPICAARQGTARAKRSSMSKSPAAARNQSTLHSIRHKAVAAETTHLCRRSHAPSRQQHGCAQRSNSIRAFRARTWLAASRPTASLRKAPCTRARRERARCGDAGRVRTFRAARRPSGLAASALRHAASAPATSERGGACMHAAMAAAHEILSTWAPESRGLEHHFDGIWLHLSTP